jgi:hypothetical protein
MEVQQGLHELGYTEPENIAFDIVSTEGRLDRLHELASELVHRKVAVIVTFGPQTTQAAREATGKIPIVMARMDDADAHGFVNDYSRPERNITGLSFQTGELSTKWVELLKEVLPQGARIAALWDATGTANQLRTIEDAARSLKVAISASFWFGCHDLVLLNARSGRCQKTSKSATLLFFPGPGRSVWSVKSVIFHCTYFFPLACVGVLLFRKKEPGWGKICLQSKITDFTDHTDRDLGSVRGHLRISRAALSRSL